MIAGSRTSTSSPPRVLSTRMAPSRSASISEFGMRTEPPARITIADRACWQIKTFCLRMLTSARAAAGDLLALGRFAIAHHLRLREQRLQLRAQRIISARGVNQKLYTRPNFLAQIHRAGALEHLHRVSNLALTRRAQVRQHHVQHVDRGLLLGLEVQQLDRAVQEL